MPEFPIRKIAILSEETFHDEILFCLAMSWGPRVRGRMGWLAAGDIKAWDGLR